MVQRLMLKSSYQDIAIMLGKLVTEIETLVEEMIRGKHIVTFQMKLDYEKAKKNKPVKEKKPDVVKTPKPLKVKTTAAGKVKRTKKVDKEKKRLRELNDQKKRNRVERLNMEADRKNLRRQPELKTKVVDYSKLITVMIDRRTAIYVKPGEDIEAAKRLYHAKIEAQKISNIDRDAKNKTKPSKKTCIRCEKEKPVSEFNKNRGCIDGYESTCKTCRDILKKKRENKNSFSL